MRYMIVMVGCVLAVLNILAEPVKMSVAGEWQVEVVVDNISAVLNIEPAEQRSVAAEKISALPLFNSKAAQYAQGHKLAEIRAQECTVRFAMDPDSLVVRSAKDGQPLVRGKDYEAELTWGCVGRLEGGAIGGTTPVVVSYQYGKMRLDSAVLTSTGKIELRKGVAHVAVPQPPVLAVGEKRLGNIWITASLKKLEESALFPISEQSYPEPVETSPSVAEMIRAPMCKPSVSSRKRMRLRLLKAHCAMEGFGGRAFHTLRY